MLTGTVMLLDPSHLRLLKIGRLRFRGLPPKLLPKAAIVKIDFSTTIHNRSKTAVKVANWD